MVEKYTTEERYVAFIDILGFKNIVNHDNEPKKVFHKIGDLKNIIEDIEKNLTKEYEDTKSKLKITWFSDSLILSIPYDDERNVSALIENVSFVQQNLLINGILIRGAITLGECYHTKNNVYGRAMVNAYELESSKSIVPRVILSEELINELESKHKNDENSDYFDVNKHLIFPSLKLDSDGLYYINYLDELLEQDIMSIKNNNKIEDVYTSTILPLRKFISNGLNNEMQIHLKYLWLKNYYNDIIKSLYVKYPMDSFETEKSISYKDLFSPIP